MLKKFYPINKKNTLQHKIIFQNIFCDRNQIKIIPIYLSVLDVQEVQVYFLHSILSNKFL